MSIQSPEKAAEFPVLRRRISQTMVNLYGSVNGDNNRIHYELDAAKEAGFDRIVVHGALVTSLLMQACRECFGLDWLAAGKLDVRFKGPCFVDDEVVTGGNLLEALEFDDQIRQRFQVWCKTADGRELVVGEALGIITKVNS